VRRSVLKQHATLFDQLMRIVDPTVIVLAGIVAYVIYPPAGYPQQGGFDMPEHYMLALAGMAVLAATLFPIAGLYEPQRGVTLFEELRRLFNVTLVMAATWAGFLFLSKSGTAFSRVWSIWWLLLTFATHVALRLSIRVLLRHLRRKGYNLRHVVIVGAGHLGSTIASRLQSSPWAGFMIRAFYDDDPAKIGTAVMGVPVRGDVDQLLRDCEEDPVDQVWVALPLRAEVRIRELLDRMRAHPTQIRFVPDIFNFSLLNHSVTEIVGLPVINLTDSPLDGPHRVTKAVEDFVLASLFLLLASPLMIAIAIAIKSTSRGPVFYRQDRVTWNGEQFRMIKFRSMPVDAEATTGPVWAKAGEQRATRVGAFLRRTSLDELPQFINVLRGEMSIVGPRPERPEFVERFRHEIPGYMQKHLVKAGITGWAQVNDLRGNTELRERIQYDLYYIENWSLWFDLRIIALTLGHLVRSRHAY